MKSKVQPKILEAAITLFGTHGFKGVTTRDLAKEADVVEGSIYQWFKSKENLYQQAINTVITRQIEDMGRFLVSLHGSPEEQSAADPVGEAVRVWCSSLSCSAARLLQQVLIADPKREKAVRQTLDSVINIISKTFETKKKINRQLKPHIAAKTLIHALFQVRVSYRNAAVAEAESKDIVEQWLLCMAAGS